MYILFSLKQTHSEARLKWNLLVPTLFSPGLLWGWTFSLAGMLALLVYFWCNTKYGLCNTCGLYWEWSSHPSTRGHTPVLLFPAESTTIKQNLGWAQSRDSFTFVVVIVYSLSVFWKVNQVADRATCSAVLDEYWCRGRFTRRVETGTAESIFKWVG